MKKTTLFILLAVCVLGMTAYSYRLATVRTVEPACSCDSDPTPMASANTNGIPDLLKTCPVSGDKLGGDMGPPYVFSYKGQEVKLCCSGCKKDFDKEPAKYIKLIRAADKK